MVFSDGAIHGLDIGTGETMRIWDLDADTPTPIEIHDFMQVEPGGLLRVVIEDSDWGSTLSFVEGCRRFPRWHNRDRDRLGQGNDARQPRRCVI